MGNKFSRAFGQSARATAPVTAAMPWPANSSPVAAAAVAVAANEHEHEVGSGRAGGGAPSLMPSIPNNLKKRRTEDDEDTNPADAKRARTEETAAAINEEVCRGQKRTAEFVADSIALPEAKRRRIGPENADEEIIRVNLPISAGDVIRAAQGSALARFMPLVTPPGEHVPTGGASFLSLPPEFREMVYQHLLVAEKPVVPRVAHRAPHYSVGFPIRTVVSLLLTHRIVYKEALGFMLMHNTFNLSIKHQRSWFHLLGRHSSNCIRRMIVECVGKNKHAVDNLTAF